MDERNAVARLGRGDIGGLEPLVVQYQRVIQSLTVLQERQFVPVQQVQEVSTTLLALVILVQQDLLDSLTEHSSQRTTCLYMQALQHLCYHQETMQQSQRPLTLQELTESSYSLTHSLLV